MSRDDDFVAKRQLKAVKAKGERHSSTIAGRMIGIFPQPLIEGTTESKGKGGGEKEEGTEMLEDMTLSIDLNVRGVTHTEDFLQLLASLVGMEKVEKDFEVLSTSEKVIRALAKGKFKNVTTMSLDGETIFRQPDDYFDSGDAIRRLAEEIKAGNSGEEIQMKLLSKDHGDCEVGVKVSSYHSRREHDILVTFEGKLPNEYFRRVINYLEGELEIEDLEEEWKRAF